MARPSRLLWMETVIRNRSGGRMKTYVGRGDDRGCYISLKWLTPGEKFVTYFEGDEVIGPGGDYISTRTIRRRFPRFLENRKFLVDLESKARRCARERGWR
jgi:hypothetical protein